MKKIRSVFALVIAAALIVSLCGCGAGGNSKYNVIKQLEKQQFCVAFRQDDVSGQAVVAALAVLEDNGTVGSLASKWFGSDVSLLEGDPDALDTLEEDGTTIEEREYIIGYDAGRLPISGVDSDGEPTGFDVELAEAFCDLLGWDAKFVAIDPSEAVVELGSGNVDCVMGGYAYDADETDIDQSPVYMNNTIVVTTLKSSGIHSLKGLSGKTLTVGNTGYFESVLDEYPELSEKPEFVNTIAGGTDECFKALGDGTADAIIADLVSLDYYK